MSRSHKARFMRYPNHHVWWMKNVRFVSRRPSPGERVPSTSAQLEEYLEDVRQAKVVAERELREQIYLSFDAWRDFEFYESDPYYDYDPRDDWYEGRSDYDTYESGDDADLGPVPCTDPRWIVEYLYGAETGYEERSDDRDLYTDLYAYDDHDDWFWDNDWGNRHHQSNLPLTAALGLAEHRQRERLKAGNRHYRSAAR